MNSDAWYAEVCVCVCADAVLPWSFSGGSGTTAQPPVPLAQAKVLAPYVGYACFLLRSVGTRSGYATLNYQVHAVAFLITLAGFCLGLGR